MDLALPRPSFAVHVLRRTVAAPSVAVLPADAISGAYDRFAALLLPDQRHSPWALTPEEEVEIERAIATFLLDPRLDELSFRDQVSTWTAAIAADAIPRSDVVLDRLADAFGWRSQAGLLGEAPAIIRINERLGALDFVAAVSRPGHELHRAWKELHKPTHSRSRRGWVRRTKVKELLTEVRQRHPEVYGWFDSGRVALWEDVVWGPGWEVWTILRVVFAFCLVSFAMNLSGVSSAPSLPDRRSTQREATPPVVPFAASPIAGLGDALSDVDRNLTSTLLTLGNGYDVAYVKRENPGLYAELAAIWRRLKAEDGRINDLDRDILAYFDSRRTHAGQVAPQALATDLLRNSLAQIEDTRMHHGEQGCAASFGDHAAQAPKPSLALMKERYDLLTRAVFEVPPAKVPATAKTRFTIPGAVMTMLAERLGWDQARLNPAVEGTGPAADICRANIELRRMLLEKPGSHVQLQREL